MAWAVCLGALSCASSMAEIITTDSTSESGFSTEIVTIDGRRAVQRSGYLLKPGRHFIEIVGTTRRTGVNGGIRGFGPGIAAANAVRAWATATKSVPLEACFRAIAGHTYEIRSYVEGGVWQVQVVDQSTTFDVKSPCQSNANRPYERP
jgi:hypothetical protein